VFLISPLIYFDPGWLEINSQAVESVAIILPSWVKIGKRLAALRQMRNLLRRCLSGLRIFFIRSIAVIELQAFFGDIPEKALLIDKYKSAF